MRSLAAVDLSDRRTARVFWGLPRICIETVLRTLNAEHGELHMRTAIPPGAILDIWQPGHPEYYRHTAIPRS
jgi:hypothetical protein